MTMESGAILSSWRHGVNGSITNDSIQVEAELQPMDLTGLYKGRVEKIILTPMDTPKLSNGQYLVLVQKDKKSEPLLSVCEFVSIHGATGRWKADRFYPLSELKPIVKGEVVNLESLSILHGRVKVKAQLISK